MYMYQKSSNGTRMPMLLILLLHSQISTKSRGSNPGWELHGEELHAKKKTSDCWPVGGNSKSTLVNSVALSPFEGDLVKTTH
jgi:hypothetical protein